jgi:hypothetical protein
MPIAPEETMTVGGVGQSLYFVVPQGADRIMFGATPSDLIWSGIDQVLAAACCGGRCDGLLPQNPDRWRRQFEFPHNFLTGVSKAPMVALERAA